LIVSARRLRPYFQAHTIIVLTDQPIRQVLAKPDISGRMTKWAIELGEFDILYHPRTSLKGQAVANFIAEFTEGDIISLDPKEDHQDKWSLYVDGSSSKRGCGGGFIAITPDNVEIRCALRYGFNATNNEAEYEALLAGLRLVRALGAKDLLVFSDSQLVVNQVNCNYTARDFNMIAYLDRVNELLRDFNCEVKQIPREQNTRADALAQLAFSPEKDLLRSVPVVIIPEPSIIKYEEKEVATIDHRSSWMDPIMGYLMNGTLPEDKNESKKMRY